MLSPDLPDTHSLDRTSPVPLYYQLRTILERYIQRGEWLPEAQIPTEECIASEYRVSKVTVRQALKQLSDEGLLRREQGRGTFVNKPKVRQGPRRLTSFSQEMSQRGMRATSRVLWQQVIQAGEDLAGRLALTPGESVFSLRRVRLADGEPMGVQTVFLPLALVPGIEAEDFSEKSLYALLSTTYGLKPALAREEHAAVALEAPEAALLSLPIGSPVLAAERLTYLENGAPLELTLSLMRGDRYKIVLNLADFSIR